MKSASDKNEHDCGNLGTVAETILGIFFDELSQIESYVDVAARLRETVLNQHKMNETSIQTAIFSDCQ